MPKMYSLYSEASILRRRWSQARNRRLEGWLRVSFVIVLPVPRHTASAANEPALGYADARTLSPSLPPFSSLPGVAMHL